MIVRLAVVDASPLEFAVALNVVSMGYAQPMLYDQEMNRMEVVFLWSTVAVGLDLGYFGCFVVLLKGGRIHF